jgi:hypothetical protein
MTWTATGQQTARRRLNYPHQEGIVKLSVEVGSVLWDALDALNEDQAIPGLMHMAKANSNGQFALCVENKDSEDLEKRKIYVVVPDEEAQTEGYLRVIDESGEDYLYPASYFVFVELPAEAQQALRVAG